MHFSESIHHCFITLCPLQEERERDEEETKGGVPFLLCLLSDTLSSFSDSQTGAGVIELNEAISEIAHMNSIALCQKRDL